MAKDYYQILGVDRKASQDDIKKAFRKLAHKYHPDKEGGDEQKFKEASEAYNVLSDEKKRAEYDAYGHVFSGAGGGGQQGGAGAAGADFESMFQDFDLGDIFGEFFGGGGGARGRTRRGRDISIDLELSFEEAVFGVQRTVLLTKTSQCEECGGTGGKPGSGTETCKTCNGQGAIRETKRSLIGTFTSTRVCDECGGTGQVPKEKCTTCGGAGVRRKEEEVPLTIPAGVNDGEMMRLSGKGEAIPNGSPGDLYVKIHVKPHPKFKKEGHNLVMDLKVKLTDAMLGAKYTVETLDGPVEVKIPANIQPGETLRLRDKGVPMEGNKRGDLLINLNIQMPNKLSAKAKKLIQQLKEEGI